MPEEAPGFEIETMMHIRIAKAGLHVVEVPSYEDDRFSGRSNLHAFRDGFKILRLILRERRRSRRSQPFVEPVAMPAAAETSSTPALAREAL
jgi:hypothetical protein